MGECESAPACFSTSLACGTSTMFLKPVSPKQNGETALNRLTRIVLGKESKQEARRNAERLSAFPKWSSTITDLRIPPVRR